MKGCAYHAVLIRTGSRGLRVSVCTRRNGGAAAETLYDLAELFKVFGDSTRIKILYALSEAELCVCDLARLLGITQAAVSHQLRVLKASALVRARREGKVTFYALDDDHVHSILRQGMEHIQE